MSMLLVRLDLIVSNAILSAHLLSHRMIVAVENIQGSEEFA